MKNMMIAFLLALLIFSYIPQGHAQDENPYPIAPVQVEFHAGDRFAVADCYPLYRDNQDRTLFVYLNGYDGLVVHACEEVIRGVIHPLPQNRESLAYNQ